MSASYSFRRDAIEKALFTAVQDSVAETAVTFQHNVRKQLSRSGSTVASGNVPSASGTPPAVQTGMLRRSFQSANSPGAYFDRAQFANRLRPTIRVGTRMKYASIHEYGGVITAKGKLLTVPIHPDAKRASMMGQGAKTFPNLVLVSRKGKSPILIRPKGKGSFDVMYVLKQSVTIPARPYVRPARNLTAKQINGIVDKHLRRAIIRLAGGRA